MGETVHHGGSATSAVATSVICAGATSIVAAAANPLRNALSIFNGASPACLYAGYGVAAAPSQGHPIPALSNLYEPDFIGTVTIAVPTGASGAVAFITEVG